MPEVTGGLAKMAVTSAVVASAAFGFATPSHTAAPQAPVSAAHAADATPQADRALGADGATDTTAPVHPVVDRQNQGH
ncbi:hypothetical protein ACFYUY_12395 [Kitasatospora sp. NPDC004745]|uniref:hypothetical protein n=1 Tax=Kitasatospora sp. NPDC004745 TaxID=3364019 RepID=UPI0036941023